MSVWVVKKEEEKLFSFSASFHFISDYRYRKNGITNIKTLISQAHENMGDIKIITMRAVGGEVGAASALAPKVGPLGLSPKKIGEARWRFSLRFYNFLFSLLAVSLFLACSLCYGGTHPPNPPGYYEKYDGLERFESDGEAHCAESPGESGGRAVSIVIDYARVKRTRPRPQEGAEKHRA